MNQSNQIGTTKSFVENKLFSEFLSVALSPVNGQDEILNLAMNSDFRTLTELPPIIFPLDASYDAIEEELAAWKEFFSEQFPADAIGEYILDMSESKGERKYVLYGNDAFLNAYNNHLDEIVVCDTSDVQTNVIFGEFNSVESLLVEIQAGKVEVEHIDLELPAGF
mgnify:CR=1 FL=1